MNLNPFMTVLWSAQSAVLPSPTAMRVALHVLWAIVLGSGTLLMAGKLSQPYRLGLAILMVSWTLLPGSASPAYWLGLAFQTPSLMTGAMCLAWFLTRARLEHVAAESLANKHREVLKILGVAGGILGWVLLLDTWACFPVSVYAWGFSAMAFAVVAVLAVLLWAALGGVGAHRERGSVAPMLVLSVLALFVLTRLPTGNVWDALIDPWLWGSLHLGWLVSAARRPRAKKRLLPATRA